MSLFYIKEAGVRDRRTGVRILVGDFLIPKHVKADYGAQIAFCAMGRPHRCSLLGVKRMGRDVDHSPPSSAEVRFTGAVPILPLGAFMACTARVCLYLPYAIKVAHNNNKDKYISTRHRLTSFSDDPLFLQQNAIRTHYFVDRRTDSLKASRSKRVKEGGKRGSLSELHLCSVLLHSLRHVSALAKSQQQAV
jgi:hypothetical protein